MTITIKPELEETLQVLAASRGVTPDDVIQCVLENFKETIRHQQLNQEPKASTLANRIPSVPVGAAIPKDALRAEGIYD